MNKGIQRVIITTFFIDKNPEENLNRLSKVMNKKRIHEYVFYKSKIQGQSGKYTG